MEQEFPQYNVKYGSSDKTMPWKGWWLEIEGDTKDMEAIDHVVYKLDPTFPNPVRRITDRSSNFRLNATGWGEFTISIIISLRDGRKSEIDYLASISYPKDEDVLKKQLGADTVAAPKSSAKFSLKKVILVAFLSLVILGIPAFAALISMHNSDKRKLESRYTVSEERRKKDSGNYTSEIVSLRDSLSKLQGDINNLTNGNSKRDADLEKLRAEIARLQLANRDLMASVNSCRADLATLSGRYAAKEKELQDSVNDFIRYRNKLNSLYSDIQLQVLRACTTDANRDSVYKRFDKRRLALKSTVDKIDSIIRAQNNMSPGLFKRRIKKEQMARLVEYAGSLKAMDAMLKEDLSFLQEMPETCSELKAVREVIREIIGRSAGQ